jgi:2-hydroxychromene-2-carboxylate isomerase
MQHLEFWFDVGCPWTWLTAEWVRQVAPERGLEIRWRVYSLTLRSLGTQRRPEPGKSFTLGAARVLEAVWADHGDSAVGPLYEHLGHAVHIDKAERTAQLLEASLRAGDLDSAYAAAAADERWDSEVRGSMADADQLAGPEVAVPILALGERPVRGFGGPVLSRRLDLDAALAVWDAYVTLASEPAFFELKRIRSDHAEV